MVLDKEISVIIVYMLILALATLGYIAACRGVMAMRRDNSNDS